MAEKYKRPSDAKPDELDRALAAALARYAVEPRAGLEERILANLRTEANRVPNHASRWSLAAGVAAVVVVALALASKSEKRHVIATHPLVTTPSPSASGIASASRNVNPNLQRPTPVRRTIVRPSRPQVALAINPRLDQFPSPQPLSEQEKLLAGYVAQFRDQAVLVARAREEALRRDREEELRQMETRQ